MRAAWPWLTLRDAGLAAGSSPFETLALAPQGEEQRSARQRPAILGIVLPGMPPGMSGDKAEPFVIYAVTRDGAAPRIYATE